MTDDVEVSPKELLRLTAADDELFYRTFFPQTARRTSAVGHLRMNAAFENPSIRYLNLRCARGWGKTSKARMFLGRRAAFGLSRTIMLLGASEDHSIRSIQWLRSRIEPRLDSVGVMRRPLFAEFFDLKPGKKWHETEIEILHGSLEQPIWVKGVGITGNIRGINFDDYRPDTILCDDVLTDENTATREQREKLIDLLGGAVRKSLASSVEDPNAKMMFLQTPMHQEDAAAEFQQDPMWSTISVPCWTDETMDSPLALQESSWPDMFPSEELRVEKSSFIRQNRLSIWTREMECRLISAETSAFVPSWLRLWEGEPPVMPCVLAIDPIPPPSDIEISKGLVGKDYECQLVLGRYKGEYWVLDYRINRGHDPNWSTTTALELARTWHVQRIVVETVGYQKVLALMLKEAMARTRVHFLVKEFKSRHKKFNRITSTLSGIASQGRLLVHPRMQELIAQWTEYPRTAHDDILDSLSIAAADLVSPYLEGDDFDDADFEAIESNLPALPNFYRSP